MSDRGSWRGVLADLERAGTAQGRSRLGAFRLEGLRLVERALRAGTPLRAVAAAQSFIESSDERSRTLLAGLAARGIVPVSIPSELAEVLTAGRGEGAIAALAELPADPGVRSLATAGGIALVAADVDDPGNVGALVRTALASCCSLYLAAGSGDPFHPRAVRTSRGAVLKQAIARCSSVESALDELAAAGITTAGAVTGGDSERLDRASLVERPLAVVVGNEATGLSKAIASRLDRRVTVPMSPAVDSFSINAAAAIVLWEARRAR